MAKLFNGLLGNSKNKIGSIVTYVMKGQQLARSKAANVSNPRTAAQMTQRIKLANVVAMYRANKAWMSRYAFETKLTKWSVFNAFVHFNLSGSLVALTKSEAAAGACVVAPYKMTDGSLGEITQTLNANTGGIETNLYVGELDVTASTTIAELSAALIANNNGIVEGMQLSLVENFQTDINGMPKVIVRAHELIVSTSDTSLVSSRLPIAVLYVNNSKLVYYPNQSTSAQGILWVLSQTISGKTYVSPATMYLTDTGTYGSYTSDVAVAAAIASYGSADETPFLDSTAVGSASNSVAITHSILSVKIGASGTPVVSGGYLGPVSMGQTIFITLNAAVAAGDITSVFINTHDEGAVEHGTPSVSGATIAVESTDEDAAPTISSIEVIFEDGTNATISFTATEGSITE